MTKQMNATMAALTLGAVFGNKAALADPAPSIDECADIAVKAALPQGAVEAHPMPVVLPTAVAMTYPEVDQSALKHAVSRVVIAPGGRPAQRVSLDYGADAAGPVVARSYVNYGGRKWVEIFAPAPNVATLRAMTPKRTGVSNSDHIVPTPLMLKWQEELTVKTAKDFNQCMQKIPAAAGRPQFKGNRKNKSAKKPSQGHKQGRRETSLMRPAR